MRIIAGKYKSRKLLAPKSDVTRPTSDRARESLFNVLNNLIDFDSIQVLDLFSGSGAFAFEALSRGAKEATLLEKERKACEAIQANAASLGITSEFRLVQKDMYKWIESANGSFDIIFADPPYDDPRTLEMLPNAIFSSGLLMPNSLVIIEHRIGSHVAIPANGELIRELSAGEAVFSFLRRKTEKTETVSFRRGSDATKEQQR